MDTSSQSQTTPLQIAPLRDEPDRRDLMKIGLGAAVAALSAESGQAQTSRSDRSETGRPIITRTGWKNEAGRAFGNGPIDETTRRVVQYVTSFSESNLNDLLLESLNLTMVDSIASLIAGFESEPARICARMARTIRSDLRCTLLGYGITTSPEMAAFGNGCMLRHADYNDLGPGGHVSDIISGILAIGEAVHSTGTQMLEAIALGYELVGALSAMGSGSGWDAWPEGPATAMAAGKLLGMNEDQLANALSLTLVPHMPMSVTHVGALSHWKGCHSSEAVRCAVFSTLLAREGMTGPSQPFEGRMGLFDHLGPPRELRLPAAGPGGKMIIQRMSFKRFPSEGSTQSVLELTPAIREFTKAENITSLHVELPFSGWQETGDPPKWDPRNRETADHSMPCVIALALLDGDVYINSFEPSRYNDPAVRALMDKITVSADPKLTYQGEARLTVKTRNGGQLVKETHARLLTPMTPTEVKKKFDRICAWMTVDNGQRDRAYAQWSNLRTVKDMAAPMRELARFGRPKAL
jgi:2-methylcitrate dehydratase